MLKIKVLGPGCYKCHRVEEVTKAALQALAEANPNIEATILHVQDPLQIHEYPILFTPGLVVNEKLVCAGRIPEIEEVTQWLRGALEASA